MDIQFVYGKMDVAALQDIDAVVCPTDAFFSGSGGLDAAVHKAAGPDLKKSLKGKKLHEGNVLLTEGFNLAVKAIVHAAVPKATGENVQSDALMHCYRNIFLALESNFDKFPCKTVAITLMGTGSRGWTFEQSMKALWDAVLDYHEQCGTSYGSDRRPGKLILHYHPDAFQIAMDYRSRISQAFFHLPAQFGTRGDFYLWFALMRHFDQPKFNRISMTGFIREIQRFSHEKTGQWLCSGTNAYAAEWDHGGTSGGRVSSFMAEVGIPLLCSALCQMDRESGESPLFLIPVDLWLYRTTKYRLTLPYELLPELTVLRKKRHEITQTKQIPLDQNRLYFLTIHHYYNAPELIDFYSLDVEDANDSHYHFAPDKADDLCFWLNCSPAGLDTALRNYLKNHGGTALEALVKPYAFEQFHY